MGAGPRRSLPLLFDRWQRVKLFGGVEIGKRNDAVRDLRAEPADVADGKDFGRDLQGQIEVVVPANAAADDQRIDADAAERGDGVGAPP